MGIHKNYMYLTKENYILTLSALITTSADDI